MSAPAAAARPAWAALCGRPQITYPYVPPIPVLELRDGDQLIVETERELSREQIRNLSEVFEYWANNQKMGKPLVLDGGLRITVIRDTRAKKAKA